MGAEVRMVAYGVQEMRSSRSMPPLPFPRVTAWVSLPAS